MEQLDQSVYVISLDAVDLNLLPTIYNTRYDQIAPLWTKSNLERRNNEYYQFEIKNKDAGESVKDQTPNLEFDKTVCHICDLEVPKPFFSEHRKSSRHKTNVKIADIAIQRLMKHINNTDNDGYTNNDEIDPSIYFCAKCVTVIDAKEKETHWKSLAHRNSLILDKILNDFLALYHCNEETNHEKPNKSIIDLEAKIYEAMQKFVNGNKNGDDSPKNLIESIEKPMQVKQNDKLEKEALSTNDYLALLKTHVNHSMFFKVQDENYLIEIETNDGSIVKVREENFHGFNRVGKKHMQCFVCKEIFKKKLLEEHKMSEKHIQYMIAPLKDKHCARQIDDSLTHCLICNTITENSDLHSLCDKDHGEYLKEALISDKLFEESFKGLPSCKELNLDSDTSSCKYLYLDKDNNTVLNEYTDNVQLGTEKKEMEESDINYKDKLIQVKNIGNVDIESVRDNGSQEPNVMPNKYFCTVCNEYISTFRRSKHNTTAKHVLNSKSKHHYLMRDIENELTCKVCDVPVPNNVENIHRHVLEKKHLEKFNQLLNENKIKRVNKDIFYCKPCDEIILFKNELIHINTKSHQAKCFSVEYIVEVTEKNENENDQVSIEYFYCNVCNVKVPNNERNIQEHVTGRSHCLNVEKNSDLTSADENGEKQKEVSNVHYQMEPTKYPGILNCKVCKVSVLHNETSISNHLIQIKHTMNYRKLLKDNYLVLKQNNCYCNICKVDVGIKCEIMHAFGKKHNRILMQKFADPNVLTDKIIHNKDYPSVSNTTQLKQTVEPYVTAVSKPSAVDTTVPTINDITKPTVSYAKKVKENIEPNNVVVNTNVKGVNNIEASISKGDNLVLAKNLGIKPEMLALLQPTANPKSAICSICKVEVPFNKFNVSTHMYGMKHKNAHQLS